MLSWSLFLLLVAVISGVLGFTVLDGTAGTVGRGMFVFFLFVVIVGSLARAVQGKTL